MILDLPWSLYSTFVIEERFGFNKQTLRTFVTDMLKSIMLQICLGMPLIAALLHVILWSGENLVLYCWLFAFVALIFFLAIFPSVIQPLFNKFETLPAGELRSGINDLAAQVGFPLGEIFVMDASRRSAHSNAYFYGFWPMPKRIVLFDTLIDQVSTDGIKAILCHELGHWKFNHTLLNIVIIELYTAAFFYLFNMCLHTTELYSAFGFDSAPAYIGLKLFTYLFTPADHVFSLFQVRYLLYCCLALNVVTAYGVASL